MQDSKTSGFSFSAIAIRQHIGTLMLTLAAIVVGIYFLFQLQVDLLPSITYPRVGVRLSAPGVSPEVAVEEITKPLEKALSATEGVVQVYSQTREGQVSIDLFFQPGGDIDQALNDATATFNRGRSTLPDTIEEPRLFKVDPSQLPIYEFALTSSSLSDKDLRVFADEELSRELSVVSGVAGVNVAGGVREEVRVLIDLNRLQALGVGLTDVLNELENRNQDVSGGRILGKNAEPLTRTAGKFQNAAEIRDLSFEVTSSNTTTQDATANISNPSRRIYLRDFADVIDGAEEQRVFAYLNGQPGVKVSIQKQPDANTISVVDGVKNQIERMRKSGLIPADMLLIPTLDESRFIRNSIGDVTNSGISGAVLAALAVLLFLGSLRQTLIISLAIPLCTLAAIILMKLFGLSINVFSLGGLALGIGQAIDTSVVILENIAQNSENEKSKQLIEQAQSNPHSATFSTTLIQPAKVKKKNFIETAIASSQEVESALVAATGANLVSVLPFLLVGGFISLLFNELILTITFAVVAALLVAISIVPMLASRLLAIEWSSGISNFWLLREFNQRFTAATKSYTYWLKQALRYRFLVVIITFFILGGSSWLMLGQIPQELLPRINTGQANLVALFPPGTTLETNRQVMNAVDEILQKQPETEYVFSTIGGSLFGTNLNTNPLRSSSSITLKPGSDIDLYVQRVNREFNKLNLVGTRLRLTPGQVRGIITTNSPVRNADIDVILQANSQEKLDQAEKLVLAALDEKVKLASFRPEADARQPEVQIRPDWERAAALGLDVAEIGETIQTAIQGSVPTQLQRGDRLVDVRVQFNQELLQEPSQLAQLPLFVENNRQIRLSDVARIEEGEAPGEIQRINQRQVLLIAGSLQETEPDKEITIFGLKIPNWLGRSQKASLSTALAEVDTVLNSIELPEGVSLLPSSAAASNKQLQSALATLGGLAAFLVFVVMAVQYNSLIDPLAIMFTVPLALAGGILGLFITNTALGATVLIGVVLLVGIVVNIGILMVELANQIREEEGCDRETAMLKAAPQRLRPIMMTTVTTVLGLFPLALGIGEGSEFLQPLGIVVFWGFSIATLMTLFIIPCFYTLLHDLFNLRQFSKRWRRMSNRLLKYGK